MNVRTIIACVVTVVWAATYIAAILVPDFQPRIEVNAVMLLVAGYFFSSGIVRGNKDKKNGTDESNP